MIRTQIYLNEKEKTKLNNLAEATGKSQSTLIREAIDEFLEKHSAGLSKKINSLSVAKGMWESRTDLPDFEALRKELDR